LKNARTSGHGLGPILRISFDRNLQVKLFFVAKPSRINPHMNSDDVAFFMPGA
jgi:hypothetical protein